MHRDGKGRREKDGLGDRGADAAANGDWSRGAMKQTSWSRNTTSLIVDPT